MANPEPVDPDEESFDHPVVVWAGEHETEDDPDGAEQEQGVPCESYSPSGGRDNLNRTIEDHRRREREIDGKFLPNGIRVDKDGNYIPPPEPKWNDMLHTAYVQRETHMYVQRVRQETGDRWFGIL